MVDIKEKIKKIYKKSVYLFKENLPQIFILFVIFNILISMRSLPYFNIINNYEFFVMAILILLAMILFRVIVPSRAIVQLVIGLFFIAIITTIFKIPKASEAIGFAIYVLLSFVVVRLVFQERSFLKKVHDKK